MKLEGRDNYGKLRQEFADRIASLSDSAFVSETEKRIWLSAYAANNPQSDYHWQAQACYAEAQHRGKPELYRTAFNQTVANA